MSNPAFIIDNPIVTLGPAPSDTGGVEIVITCDLTRAEITNNVNMVDTGTLCGPAQLPGRITYTLELEGWQAFDAATNAWRWLWEHQRETVPFSIVPKNGPVSATNPEVTGECVCVPGELGGKADDVAAFTASLPIVGVPVLSDTGTMSASAPASSSSTPAATAA